jgi:hypothetical protein
MTGVRFTAWGVVGLALLISVACGGSTDDGDSAASGGSAATTTGGSGARSSGGEGAASGGTDPVGTGGDAAAGGSGGGRTGGSGGTPTGGHAGTPTGGSSGASTGGSSGAPAGGAPGDTGGAAGDTGGAAGDTGGAGGADPLGEACTAPMVVGSCDAAFFRWWHDPDTGVCQPFIYGGCGANANNYETEAACNAACAGYPDELDACDTNLDCVVTSAGCCEACEPVTPESLVAVRSEHAQTYREARVCDDVRCGSCPHHPVDERTGKFFQAVCDAGQCTVRDVREQPFTECSVAEDCRLRCGSDCCECGFGDEVVAVRADTDEGATFCAGTPADCDCECTIPDRYQAGCVDYRCVVLGQGDCAPGFNYSCNSNPNSAVIWGVCNEDATCTCNDDYTLSPDTGLCIPNP